MSEFFKSKGKFGVALAALLMAVTVLAGSFAYLQKDISPPADAPTVNRAEFDAAPAGGNSTSPNAEEEPAAVDVFAPDNSVPLAEADAEEPREESAFAQSNTPSEMRGAFLVPGVDFLATRDTSESAIKAEVDKAFSNARMLDINSVIIDTEYDDMVIYQTMDAPELSTDFDILGYVVDKARSEGFYTYAIFDASFYDSGNPLAALMAVGAGSINKLSSNLNEFVTKYKLDGVLIDGFANEPADTSYASYLTSGGGIGFDNFLRQSPAATVKTAAKAIRKASPGTQVGLLTDAVWENQSANEQGSATEAAYTSLSDGNADTKGFIERGYVDFFAVKAYGSTESKNEPFEEVVSWWADVALRHDVPMYVVHATDKLFGDEAGWGTSDQIIRQIDTVLGTSGARGSIFNDLTKLASNQSVATNIQKLYEGEVSAEQVLTKLEMTKPTQSTFTTADPQVTFTGASDPAEPVTINDEDIQTDASGYFTVQYDLATGLNTFVISHKDKTITYKITRKIEILKDVSPKGNIAVDGGTAITISAFAYEEADVYATVNGAEVQLKLDSAVESESTRDGFFRSFSGNYTVPAAAAEDKELGKITVHAEYQGEKSSLDAATVKVNKKAPEPEVSKPEVEEEDSGSTSSVKPKDGAPVRITADQAITYPPDTLNNIPVASYYPLPAGAMDYAVGDEVTFTKEGKTYTYTKLASGLRVATKDLTAVSEAGPENNTISGLSVTSDAGYTYVTLKMDQKVAYSVKYTSSGISFTFHYTKNVPGGSELSKNPIFTSAGWSGQTLTLSFVKSGAFMGYKGYYDGNSLVLRFNNPPASLSGARIAIDPGHGGKDKGADGFLAEYPESVINSQIAAYVAEELQSRGATVNLMNNANIEGEQRKQAAEKWEADLFVSIHSNSAPNIKATGTEVYYFHPFSQLLAQNAASAVSGGLSTNNRGAKQSYYHVTLSSQMPSVLIETGFLTNQGEYEKLINAKYQKQIAVGIADAISATIKGTATGRSASGSESTGDSDTSGDKALESLSVQSSARVAAGKTTTIVPDITPTDAKADLVWDSSDTSVATVDSGGKVTGIKAGSSAKITVSTRDGKHSATCTVTVVSADSGGVSVTGVALDATHFTLSGAGSSRRLVANVKPEDANANVSWSSGSPDVARVDASGNVTAVADGMATITVKTEDGGYTASCTVTVTGSGSSSNSGNPLTSSDKIAAQPYSKKLTPGQTDQLIIVNQYQSVIRGADFTWTSSNPDVLSVASPGVITAKAVGSAATTITATSQNGRSVSWSILVDQAVEGLQVSYNGQIIDSEITLGNETTGQFTCTLLPANAPNSGVSWQSGNVNVLDVYYSGKFERKQGADRVKITVTSESNPQVQKVFYVNVK